MKTPFYLISCAFVALAASAPNTHSPRQEDSTVAVSPGVASSSVTIQVPVNIPVNICGNSITVIGLLNPAFGNTCVNSRRRDLELMEMEKCNVEASYDEDCQAYTFKVPQGVVVDVCGCKVGPGKVEMKQEIKCGDDDCVTIGTDS